jgi:hypothetical protein
MRRGWDRCKLLARGLNSGLLVGFRGAGRLRLRVSVVRDWDWSRPRDGANGGFNLFPALASLLGALPRRRATVAPGVRR